MNINKLINYQNFEKILMVIIVVLFSISAFELTQNRGTPQETDDRYAYELKSTHFLECFTKKNCVGLNSFSKFLTDERIINYNSIEKKNRDLQRILYSYHPFYSFLEIISKIIFKSYSKLILILSINLFVLYSIYCLSNFFFNKKVFYFSSIILFFNPLFPGLISGYPFILSTSFAIFSLINFQKKNFFLYYLTLILASASHIFGLLFICFFIILNYIKKFVKFKSAIKTLTNVNVQISNLILLSIFFLIYLFPINFTNTLIIKGSNFFKLSYLSSINEIYNMMIVKLLIVSKFLHSFYLLGVFFLIVTISVLCVMIILFLQNYKNLNLELKSILISLLIFFIFIFFFPNILIVERFLPFYSIILIPTLTYSILNLKKFKKLGFCLLITYCVFSIFAGSNNLLDKRVIYENRQDLIINEEGVKKYSEKSDNLFLFISNEASFYKFLIEGLHKNNYFLNIRHANVDLGKIKESLNNIYLVSNSKLIDRKGSTINSNINKKIKILSNDNLINKILLFSFYSTSVNINDKNFKILPNNVLEVDLTSTNNLHITSKEKIYILKILDENDKALYDFDIFVNEKQINQKNKNIKNKIINFKKNNCELNLYDVMYANVIYKVNCTE